MINSLKSEISQTNDDFLRVVHVNPQQGYTLHAGNVNASDYKNLKDHIETRRETWSEDRSIVSGFDAPVSQFPSNYQLPHLDADGAWHSVPILKESFHDIEMHKIKWTVNEVGGETKKYSLFYTELGYFKFYNVKVTGDAKVTKCAGFGFLFSTTPTFA